VGAGGRGFDNVVAGGWGCDGVGGTADVGVTAAAAAAEYRIGGKDGRGACCGRPALRMLAIGCCVKFGGGFAVQNTYGQ
jgi:hypothetical protein